MFWWHNIDEELLELGGMKPGPKSLIKLIDQSYKSVVDRVNDLNSGSTTNFSIEWLRTRQHSPQQNLVFSLTCHFGCEEEEEIILREV